MVLVLAALLAGIVIGLVDSSPGWDSTGITAVALALAAAVVAWIGRDRPWLWALLVGLPTPLLDIVRTGNSGSVLAVGFAALGAAVGWVLHRSRSGRTQVRRRRSASCGRQRNMGCHIGDAPDADPGARSSLPRRRTLP
jgi:hypothetical protein